MKNIFASVLAIIIVILIGSLFMKTTSSDEEISSVNHELNVIKAFQIGAYKTKESAVEIANKNNGAISFDGEYYYVYIAILEDLENIEKMMRYLSKNNTYYYLKNITVPENFKSNLIKYEELMKSTTTEIAFLELNKQLLRQYKENI